MNDLFLKKPERIEVLGAVLLMALLIWNLIEHSLRQYITENETTLPGVGQKENKPPYRLYDEYKVYEPYTCQSCWSM